MKRILLYLLVFSFCSQGVSEQDLQVLTDEAVKVALEEISQQAESTPITKINESDSSKIETPLPTKLSESKDSNTNEESTTTTVARSTTTTAPTTTTTTVAITTTTSTTTTTLPWASYAGSRYECVELLLGKGKCTTGSNSFANIIYCDSIKENSNCSEYWFPSVLLKYEIFDTMYSTVICEDAGYGSYSPSDRDCGRYEKGQDPSNVSKYDKCTVSYSSITCNDDYYPSELNDYQLAQINGWETYVCERGGSVRCYRYNGGSLHQAAKGAVAYYCPYGVTGTCNEDSW